MKRKRGEGGKEWERKGKKKRKYLNVSRLKFSFKIPSMRLIEKFATNKT